MFCLRLVEAPLWGAPLLPRAGRHLGRAVVCCHMLKARSSFGTRVADPGCQLHVWKSAPVVRFQALKYPRGFQFGPKLISMFRTILPTNPPALREEARGLLGGFQGSAETLLRLRPCSGSMGLLVTDLASLSTSPGYLRLHVGSASGKSRLSPGGWVVGSTG